VSDVVVIGTGLAGLTSAIRLARSGASVTLLSAGIGGLQLSQGTIDVLGYAPDVVEHPFEAMASLPADHPYAILGPDRVRRSLDWFASLLPDGSLEGTPDANMRTPTAVGVARPTALAPPSIAAGRLTGARRLAIVGVRAVKDFQPGIIAANLSRLDLGDGPVDAVAGSIDVVPRDGVDHTALVYARSMDDPEFRRRMGGEIARAAGEVDAVGVPAMVGLRDPEAWSHLCEIVGRPVFEIPLPPPSVPGMRLNAALTYIARSFGVRMVMGGHVISARTDASGMASVTTDTAGRPREHRAGAFVFAPGGFESGALHVDSYWNVSEPALGLPLTAIPDGEEIVSPDYWADHPVFRVGVAADEAMRAIGPGGDPVHPNLVVAGGILAGATRWREKSGEGIAIASAVQAADTIIGARQ